MSADLKATSVCSCCTASTTSAWWPTTIFKFNKQILRTQWIYIFWIIIIFFTTSFKYKTTFGRHLPSFNVCYNAEAFLLPTSCHTILNTHISRPSHRQHGPKRPFGFLFLPFPSLFLRACFRLPSELVKPSTPLLPLESRFSRREWRNSEIFEPRS